MRRKRIVSLGMSLVFAFSILPIVTSNAEAASYSEPVFTANSKVLNGNVSADSNYLFGVLIGVDKLDVQINHTTDYAYRKPSFAIRNVGTDIGNAYENTDFYPSCGVCGRRNGRTSNFGGQHYYSYSQLVGWFVHAPERATSSYGYGKTVLDTSYVNSASPRLIISCNISEMYLYEHDERRVVSTTVDLYCSSCAVLRPHAVNRSLPTGTKYFEAQSRGGSSYVNGRTSQVMYLGTWLFENCSFAGNVSAFKELFDYNAGNTIVFRNCTFSNANLGVSSFANFKFENCAGTVVCPTSAVGAEVDAGANCRGLTSTTFRNLTDATIHPNDVMDRVNWKLNLNSYPNQSSIGTLDLSNNSNQYLVWTTAQQVEPNIGNANGLNLQLARWPNMPDLRSRTGTFKLTSSATADRVQRDQILQNNTMTLSYYSQGNITMTGGTYTDTFLYSDKLFSIASPTIKGTSTLRGRNLDIEGGSYSGTLTVTGDNSLKLRNTTMGASLSLNTASPDGSNTIARFNNTGTTTFNLRSKAVTVDRCNFGNTLTLATNNAANVLTLSNSSVTSGGLRGNNVECVIDGGTFTGSPAATGNNIVVKKGTFTDTSGTSSFLIDPDSESVKNGNVTTVKLSNPPVIIDWGTFPGLDLTPRKIENHTENNVNHLQYLINRYKHENGQKHEITPYNATKGVNCVMLNNANFANVAITSVIAIIAIYLILQAITFIIETISAMKIWKLYEATTEECECKYKNIRTNKKAQVFKTWAVQSVQYRHHNYCSNNPPGPLSHRLLPRPP